MTTLRRGTGPDLYPGLMQKALVPALHMAVLCYEWTAEVPESATHIFLCVLALFLEMAQLSSYDSPDTPETDDSVEVKILCSRPNPGAWAL